MQHVHPSVGQHARQFFARTQQPVPAGRRPSQQAAMPLKTVSFGAQPLADSFSHSKKSHTNQRHPHSIHRKPALTIRFAGKSDAAQNLPVVDLRDFSSDDAAKRLEFVQKLGNSLKDYGFVAVAGHDIPPELISDYYETAKDVFDLPLETKLKYVREETGRNRGYYELGRELKAATAGGEKKFPDPKENFHTGAVDNQFPTETVGKVPEFKEAAPKLYQAMEKTSIKLVDAIGQFLDSIGLKDNGYLKSTMVNDKGKPIGSHLLRSIHYPPVKPEDRARFKPGEPVIRAGEHYDLNLITLLPESIESGLEILRRKEGEEDHWLPIHSQQGHLICNSGDMLSFVTGGTTNERGNIAKQGKLPSIRHRVVGDQSTLDKHRYSTPFFATPHYDKPLKNLETQEEMPTGKFVHRRLQGNASLDKSVDYETFRKNVDNMVIKDKDS